MALMQKFSDALLFLVVLSIPLNQLLYIEIGGFNIKVYQGLLVLVVLTTLAQIRFGEPLWAWQKFGLVFFICAVISEMVGFVLLQQAGSIPQSTKDSGNVGSYFAVITIYLFSSMCFALQIARFVLRSPEHFVMALNWATLSALFPTLYGIYQITSFFFGYEISFLEFERIVQREDAVRGGIYFNEGLGRISSTYFEPTPYGSFLSAVVPLSITAIRAQWRKKMPVWQMIVLLLSVVNIGLSFSTTGVLAIGIFVGGYLILSKTSLQGFWIAGIIVGGLAAIWLLVDSEQWLWKMIDTFIIKKLTEDGSASESLSRRERIEQIRIGLDLFLKYPIFGVGPYLPLFVEIEKLNSPFNVHSSIAIVYVQILVAYGLVGTLVASLFFYRLSSKLWFFKPINSPLEIQMLRPALCALLATLYVMLVSLGTLVATHFWLIIGLIIGFLQYEEQGEETNVQTPMIATTNGI